MSDNSMMKEIKSGFLLKYKKRIFKSNWRQSQVTLFDNATILASNNSSIRSSTKSKFESSIPMSTQTTLIIFGRQLNDVPKVPLLPSGYRLEQLLAIGLICNLNADTKSSNSNGSSPGSNKRPKERLSIIFHWFLMTSIQELFEWIVAINSIIPANKQIFTDEELTMSLIMSEVSHFNNLQLIRDANQSTVNMDPSTGQNSSGIDSSNTRTTQATVEWTLSGTEGGTSGDTMTDGYLATDATTYGNDFGADTMGMDCGDFDDCSAYASADAFAIF